MTRDRSLNVSRALSSEASKDAALGGAAGEKGAITSLARQRLMQELRHLSKNPHPAMDVFPVESNLAFWNVVMTGFPFIPFSHARTPFPRALSETECAFWAL